MRLVTPIVPPQSLTPESRTSRPSPAVRYWWPARLTAAGDEPAALAVVVKRAAPRATFPLLQREEPRRVEGSVPCELVAEGMNGALVPVGAVPLGARVYLPEEDDGGVWNAFIVLQRIWSEPPSRRELGQSPSDSSRPPA